jgi:hypothetical protein
VRPDGVRALLVLLDGSLRQAREHEGGRPASEVGVNPIRRRVYRCSPRHLKVYQCSPRHPPRSVPVLATSSTTQCTSARDVTRISVLATSFTAQCTGARHVIHDTVYRCWPHHPPRSVPVLATSSTSWCTSPRDVTRVSVLATSSTTQCTGARHVFHLIVYKCTPLHPPRSVPVTSNDVASNILQSLI